MVAVYDGEECWRTVEEFDGQYEVSDWGNVRSVDKTLEMCGNHNVKYNRFFPGKLLSLISHPTGYITVRLSHQGKAKTRRVHKLVAQAFIPNEMAKAEINHINHDRHDNRVENIEWCTRQENEDHKYGKGKHGKR